MAQRKWGIDLTCEEKVVSEDHLSVSSSDRPIFNLDFAMDFCENAKDMDFLSTVESALPNSVGGADLFLAVHKVSYQPLSFKLILGDAFPLRFFADCINSIESHLQDHVMLSNLRAAGIGQDELERALHVEESVYCRILLVGEDICFLYFMEDDRPVQRASRYVIPTHLSRGEVDCHVAGSRILCFDGWISTGVPNTEIKVVAVRDRR